MGNDRNRLRPSTCSHVKNSQPINQNQQNNNGDTENDSPDIRSKAGKKNNKPRPTPRRAYKGAMKSSTEGSFNDITAAEVLASLHTTPKDPLTTSVVSLDLGLECDEPISMPAEGKDLGHHGLVADDLVDNRKEDSDDGEHEMEVDEDDLSSDTNAEQNLLH